MDWQQQQQQQQQYQQPEAMPALVHDLLYSVEHEKIKYDARCERFLYEVEPERWKRAYGLTKMMGHAFWPDYDARDPRLLAAAARIREQYKTRTTRGGTYTKEQVVALASRPPESRVPGWAVGKEAHRQLYVWAMDRFRNTRHFSRIKAPLPHTLAIVSKLAELGIEPWYSELMIYDPRVPVATSVDLVGWSRRYRAVVLVEVKTGYKWTMELGTAPMRGRAAAILKMTNAPLNQAIVQLAIMHAIVADKYRIPRVMGLLVWASGPSGVSAMGTQVRWLDDRTARAGRVMLAELKQHMDARGGRAWVKL